MGHFDAKAVEAGDKSLRFFHAVLEALVADQAHRFHEGAGGVAQQDPVHRIVDVGFQAGGVQKGAFQIQRLGQMKGLWGGSALVGQLINDLTHLLFGPPLVVTFEGAFAGDLDAAQFVDAAEVLQQRTVGQSGGKDPILLAEQLAGEVAPQSAAAVALVVLLGAGADLAALSQPALEIGLKEAGFQAALKQELVNAQEVVAKLTVIDIALDGGEGLRQRHLKGNNSGVRHGR